jgi:hypothetical protein
MLFSVNELQVFSKRQGWFETLEIPHVRQQKLFLLILGVGLGGQSRNSWIFFVILRDGEVIPRSQLLTDVDEIPTFAATSVCSQCSSKRCLLMVMHSLN